MSTTPTIHSAIKFHTMGSIDQAESIYRQLLEIDPRNANALYLLGVLAHQIGKNQIAVDLYKIESTQIIQTCCTLASTATLLHGATFVGGDK